MTVNSITDTKKGRTGIAPTYLHTTPWCCQNLSSRVLKVSVVSADFTIAHAVVSIL